MTDFVPDRVWEGRHQGHVVRVEFGGWWRPIRRLLVDDAEVARGTGWPPVDTLRATVTTPRGPEQLRADFPSRVPQLTVRWEDAPVAMRVTKQRWINERASRGGVAVILCLVVLPPVERHLFPELTGPKEFWTVVPNLLLLVLLFLIPGRVPPEHVHTATSPRAPG